MTAGETGSTAPPTKAARRCRVSRPPVWFLQVLNMYIHVHVLYGLRHPFVPAAPVEYCACSQVYVTSVSGVSVYASPVQCDHLLV